MKRWMKISAMVLMCLILCVLSGSSVRSEETDKTLKVLVPLMNDSGFVTYEDGIFSGYYIDYLMEISKYTGWNYEFTAIESYDDLDLACEQGDFDFMTGILYTEEYDDAYFEYPEHIIGAKRYVFAVPKDSGLIPDGEYSYLRGTRIGIASNSGITELEERFSDFCFMYGISCVSDLEQDYDRGVNFLHIDPSSWKEKIASGDIDGILASDAFCLSQKMYAITSFGLDQIYFVAPNGHEEIVRQLDDALEKIISFDPEYNNRLYEKYFSSNMQYRPSFNQEEKDFINQGHAWKVSLVKDCAPYSYVNDTGMTAGVVPEVLKRISEQTGGKVHFECVFYDSIQEASDAVKNGECDIYGTSMYSLLLKRDSRERKSMSYYKDSFLYYKNNRMAAGDDTEAGMGRRPGGLIQNSADIKKGNKAENQTGSHLEQVNDGTYSFTIMLGHVGDYYKSYYGYNNLVSYPVPDGDIMFCFAYSSEMEQTAVTIIDKCLTGVQKEDLDAYITEVSLFEHKSHTMQDYIKEHMEFFALLLAGILFVICTLLVIIVISVSRNSKKIYALLYKDDITGGISYKKFKEEAGRVIRKPGKRLMLYVNINSFKYINDVFGYERGNEVLCEVKTFLEDCVQGALLARIYADRFVALIPYNSLEEVKRLMQENLTEFEEVCRNKFPSFNIWVKVGAYTLLQGDDIQKAVNLANYAVDEIQKTSESNCIFYDETMYERVLIQKDIEKDMRGAMEHEEFEPYYQPKYNIETKELIGAEALVRWRHPEKGLLSPGIFIPIFEKNHFIIQVDFYIFERVCIFIKKLIEEGRKLFPISSNFSRLHLSQPDFVERLTQIVNKHQVPPQYLEIEITETVATEDFDRFITAVKQLKKEGFLVSIDDFGSGYSSIQLLYKLPIDVLKFDKAFVDNEDVSEFEAELVDSIISVSHKNGIQIICEGVETPEQEEFVRKHNCIFVQGFLYSKPVPESDFRKLMVEK